MWGRNHHKCSPRCWVLEWWRTLDYQKAPNCLHNSTYAQRAVTRTCCDGPKYCTSSWPPLRGHIPQHNLWKMSLKFTQHMELWSIHVTKKARWCKTRKVCNELTTANGGPNPVHHRKYGDWAEFMDLIRPRSFVQRKDTTMQQWIRPQSCLFNPGHLYELHPFLLHFDWVSDEG